MNFITPVIDTALALALIRAVAGFVIAAHGAQKVFGVWGGPGFAGWSQGIARMGLRPVAFWAFVSAYAEFAGGIAFALGLLVPIVGAALTIQMGVAIARAHWSKGFFNSKGGLEFPLTLGAIAAFNGIADPGVYALDAALGLRFGAGLYALTLVIGVVAYLLGSRRVAAEQAKAKAVA